MVSKEDISGSYDIVNLALRVFGVHRLSGNENLGEMTERTWRIKKRERAY